MLQVYDILAYRLNSEFNNNCVQYCPWQFTCVHAYECVPCASVCVGACACVRACAIVFACVCVCEIYNVCNRVYCMCFRLWPFNLSFLSFLFFDWVGVVWPQLSKAKTCVLGPPRPFIVMIVQELCESRGGRPVRSVLTNLLVSVDVKLHWTMFRHWSQLVPNMSADIWGH